MGRNRVIRPEPMTSISVYMVDSMLLDDYRIGRETKSEALRRLFITMFGEEKVKEKKEEMIKKLVRQQSTPRAVSDQKTIDNVFYPDKTFKDLLYTRDELLAIITQATRFKRVEAYNSILKAINRGDAEKVGENYKIATEWWKDTPLQQMARI